MKGMGGTKLHGVVICLADAEFEKALLVKLEKRSKCEAE